MNRTACGFGSTRNGPIISDHGAQTALEGYFVKAEGSFPRNVELTSVSLHWSALQPGSVVKAVLLLDGSTNYRQFRDALRWWDAPALNILYADVDGNIAYQCVGRIPIRAQGSGEAPVPGWTRRSGVAGVHPLRRAAVVVQPPERVYRLRQQPAAGPTYRHLLGKELDYGYRARRIVEMIESHKGPMGVQDIQAMQADDLNRTALEVCAALKALDLSPRPSSSGSRRRRERGSPNGKFVIARNRKRKSSLSCARHGIPWRRGTGECPGRADLPPCTLSSGCSS